MGPRQRYVSFLFLPRRGLASGMWVDVLAGLKMTLLPRLPGLISFVAVGFLRLCFMFRFFFAC